MIYVQILLCNSPSLLSLLSIHGVLVLQMGPGKKTQQISNFLKSMSCVLHTCYSWSGQHKNVISGWYIYHKQMTDIEKVTWNKKQKLVCTIGPAGPLGPTTCMKKREGSDGLNFTPLMFSVYWYMWGLVLLAVTGETLSLESQQAD